MDVDTALVLESATTHWGSYGAGFFSYLTPGAGQAGRFATTPGNSDRKWDMFELGGVTARDSINYVDRTQQKTPRWSSKLDSSDASTRDKGFVGLLERQTTLRKRLSTWRSRFRIICERDTAGQETASYLLMYYHSSCIWLETCPSPAQMAYDTLTYHFEELVRHAEIYVRAKAVTQLTFTLEVGAVAPLYLASTRCRIPSLRRRAVDLMTRAPRKECVWGAESTAELVCRLIAIEEDGLGHPQPTCSGRCATDVVDDTVLPPEHMRVHNFELLKDEMAQAFEVRVTRYSNVSGYAHKIVEDFAL